MIYESDTVVWLATDPQDRKIILKESTLNIHIAGSDHDRQDSAFRKQIMSQAQQTIINPEIIVKDKSRLIYFRIIVIPYQETLVKLKPIKVVVDIDRQPNEVVTWTPLNKMNTTFESEAIIYAKPDRLSSANIR